MTKTKRNIAGLERPEAVHQEIARRSAVALVQKPHIDNLFKNLRHWHIDDLLNDTLHDSLSETDGAKLVFVTI